MFGFIKRLLGGGMAAPIKGDPFSRDVSPQYDIPLAPIAPVKGTQPAVLQRDEIIDARTRIAGYRFSVRHPDTTRQLGPQIALEILAANKIATFAERRLALIPLSLDDWPRHDYKPLIGPNTAFLLSLQECAQEEEARNGVMTSIHCAGARIALSGCDMVAHRELFLEHADFLLLDFSSYSLANFEHFLKTLRREKPKLKIIAEKVSRWPEHRFCVSNGIAYCLGPFTTEQDEEQQAAEIGQSRLVLIEMLNQLRKEADLVEIAQIAKRDPGVIVKVVAMANSPILGLSQAVTSIDQAIMVLGREQLYRWLSICMFRTGTTAPRDAVLLELALARGRFLEVLGQGKHNKLECDELFLLGLLSLLDSLLGLPMSVVVAKMHLSPALKEVLLSSSGPLGRYLMRGERACPECNPPSGTAWLFTGRYRVCSHRSDSLGRRGGKFECLSFLWRTHLLRNSQLELQVATKNRELARPFVLPRVA